MEKIEKNEIISSNMKSLKEHDGEMYELIQLEKQRQKECIELIASENFTSNSVMECLGSCLTNKYSEGQVGARYYGGNEYIDQIEDLTKKRVLKAYGLNDQEWAVNVQPYSGSPANFIVYTALIKPGEKMMGLDLPSGGHLTHGFQTENKKISATSLYFETKPYKVNNETGLIEYDQLAKDALEFKPQIIICGYSAYSRDLDYKRFREIADSVNAFLMADISHYSGFVASKLMNSPFEYCDVITSTTHKSLRGPRSGMIISKKDDRKLYEKIDFAAFPMLQGGPHNNVIAAIGTQMKEVMSDEFKEYSKQVLKNSKHMASTFVSKGYQIATGGTDNHLMLLDLRPLGLTGNKVEKAFDMVNITLNKNSIVGDKSALSPGAVRIGTPAVTTRGMKEKDMEIIVEFIDETLILCKKINETSGKTVKEFLEKLSQQKEINDIKKRIIEFTSKFEMPGI